MRVCRGVSPNPASTHLAGQSGGECRASRAPAVAATMLNTDPDRLVFTSGATESDNIAIRGAAKARAGSGTHLVTMPTEHKAVTGQLRALEREGFEVTWLAPSAAGVLDPADLKQRRLA